MDYIRVQEEDFCLSAEYESLEQSMADHSGAIVFFVGKVRGFNDEDRQEDEQKQNNDKRVTALVLEHYPKMTEQALERIVNDARERWCINAVRLIHRVGIITENEQIVLVAVSAAHREEAFQSVQFIMDYLKNNAPFWKKEVLANGEKRWVKAKQKDKKALLRWDM